MITVLEMRLPFGKSSRPSVQDQGSANADEPVTATITSDHTPIPEGDEAENLLHQRLAGLRDRLLDLSNRNRLLSFKHSERSRTHIRIIDELPDVLFAKLKDGEIVPVTGRDH